MIRSVATAFYDVRAPALRLVKERPYTFEQEGCALALGVYTALIRVRLNMWRQLERVAAATIEGDVQVVCEPARPVSASPARKESWEEALCLTAARWRSQVVCEASVTGLSTSSLQ
eukprot:6195134-Pleurochrysis_carterae.AAC.4